MHYLNRNILREFSVSGHHSGISFAGSITEKYLIVIATSTQDVEMTVLFIKMEKKNWTKTKQWGFLFCQVGELKMC